MMDRFPIGELPDISIKGTKFFLNLKKASCIINGTIDFSFIPDNTLILKKGFNFFLIVSCNFTIVKVI